MPQKNKNIPFSAAAIGVIDKSPVAQAVDYTNAYPCWRISNFDKDGPWGLNSLLNFTFRYNNSTYQAVFNSGNQSIDNALVKLKNKQISNRQEFWDKVKSLCSCDIPVEVVERIEEEIICNVFMEKIFPKLLQFESMTWDEIRQQTHGGKGKSSSHNIDVDDLNPKAKERLKILKFDDRDKIYSLRLEGTVRIFGFKELNYLDIIWIDLNHEVCPSKQK